MKLRVWRPTVALISSTLTLKPIFLQNYSNCKRTFLFSGTVSECDTSSWLPPASSWFPLESVLPAHPVLRKELVSDGETLNQLHFSVWNLSDAKMGWWNSRFCYVQQGTLLLILSIKWKRRVSLTRQWTITQKKTDVTVEIKVLST